MNKLKLNLYSKILVNNISTPPKPNVILNFFSSLIEHKLGKTTLLSSPTSAVLYINKTCNYTCGFCYNQDILNKTPFEEGLFEVNDLEKFFKSQHGMNILRVALMGGEPFINKNIFDLIRLCKEHHKIVNVVSNGSLIRNEMVPIIKKSKLDAIGLSLYDNNLDHIERLSFEFNKYNVNYWVQTVIDATKISEIEEKLFFAKRARIKNFILSNYNPSFDSSFEKILLKTNAGYTREMIRLKSLYSKSMNIIWPKLLPKRYLGTKKMCPLPFSYIHLDNNGSIAPCCYRYPKPEYGNLYKNDGWNSPFNQMLRQNMLNPNQDPIGECKNCENLYRNLYF